VAVVISVSAQNPRSMVVTSAMGMLRQQPF